MTVAGTFAVGLLIGVALGVISVFTWLLHDLRKDE